MVGDMRLFKDGLAVRSAKLRFTNHELSGGECGKEPTNNDVGFSHASFYHVGPRESAGGSGDHIDSFFKVFDVAVDCVTLLHATSKCLNLRDMEGIEAWKVSFKREYIRPGSRQSCPTLARAFLF